MTNEELKAWKKLPETMEVFKMLRDNQQEYMKQVLDLALVPDSQRVQAHFKGRYDEVDNLIDMEVDE